MQKRGSMTNLATSSEIVISNEQSLLAIAGQVANGYASGSVFIDYQQRKSANTLRRQAADLQLFTGYLADAGISTGKFLHDPAAWEGMTWGLVEGFVRWQLEHGYAIGSVNVRLATVKNYAKLAMKAGSITTAEYALIMTVKGYGYKEGRNIDAKRSEKSMETRRGAKKAFPVTLTAQQASMLINQPDSPQGRRDALLMALLLDHGLRVGEVALISVTDFDLHNRELKFYRPKVDKVQTHKFTSRTFDAAKRYFEHDVPPSDSVWRASASKADGRECAGKLTTQGFSERAITKRVETLGRGIGVEGLSAHDCRHHWATQAARSGTAIDRLQDAGGWSSPVMPLRYVESAKIANEGVKLVEF